GGIVLACEHNLVRATGDPTAHAEVVAIRSACQALGTTDLAGSDIYCTCEPCLMCFGACQFAGFASVTYGAGIDDKEAMGLPDPGVRCDHLNNLCATPVRITAGLLRGECVELFREFL